MYDDSDTPIFVTLESVIDVPLRETITSVLRAFEGTGISSDHLAAQIETQVRSWIRYNYLP